MAARPSLAEIAAVLREAEDDADEPSVAEALERGRQMMRPAIEGHPSGSLEPIVDRLDRIAQKKPPSA